MPFVTYTWNFENTLLWLVTFALCLLGVALSVARSQPARERAPSRRLMTWLGWCLCLFPLAVIGTDVAELAAQSLPELSPTLTKTAIGAGVLLVSQAIFRPYLTDSPLLNAVPVRSKEQASTSETGEPPLLEHLQKRDRVRWMANAALLAFAAWAWWRCEDSFMPHDECLPLDVVEKALTTVDAVSAFTDKGRQIPLSQLPKNLKPNDLSRVPDSFAQVLIRRGPADIRTNCHGWVFADGRYLVRSADVPRILEDNDYRRVDESRPGDLVVYRSADGAAIHTGIVRAVGDGLVLVESKWGVQGRFLHRVEDQIYGSRYSFYRSERRGHALRLVDATGPRTDRRNKSARRTA